MSEDTGERVGARPLSAFATTEIVVEGDEQQEQNNQEETTTIGITPLPTVLSDDTEDTCDSNVVPQETTNSILMSQDEHVFGLLQDPHADPPIEGGGETKTNNNGEEAGLFAATSPPTADQEDSSDEEYHSPLEDNIAEEEQTKKKPMITSSPYDYDVNWDMVGHAGQQEQQQQEDVLNTSLAEAAAASMIATTAAAAASTTTTIPDEQQPPLIPPQQPFSFRRTASASSGRRNPYRYQKYTHSSDELELEEEENIIIQEEQEFTNNIPTIDTAPSEMNESTASTSSSSNATPSAAATSTRRRRRRHGRAQSFSSPRTTATEGTTTLPSNTATTSSSRTSSLDSGMAAVRRWIRSRTAGGGSSRAARRWQREQNSLQLGEEDLFALTNAGEDPRRSSDLLLFPSILEEEELGVGAVRQRALSEPNNIRMRNFFFQRAAHGPPSNRSFRARSSTRRSTASGDSISLDDEASSRSGSALSTSISVPTHLSSAALNSSLFHSPTRSGESSSSMHGEVVGGTELLRNNNNDGDVSSLAETSVPPQIVETEVNDDEEEEDEDPNREARTRWIRINRRFQLIITVVALIFSLLLFAILVCWVVFTSAYVVSIDKTCDVPLKQYFWLATLQLILDVFRTDIMRFIFRWDTHSNDRIPVRVIMYNIAYLIYAMLVLRLGIKSVFKADDSTCPSTAPELYQSGAVFVSLSIAAWSTIVLGYLVPFCFVATLLTWNGYTPTAENQEQNHAAPFVGGVFPAAYSTTGAPPGCVDQLRTVLLEEFPDDYPQECCICMGDFVTGEVIVATECQHVFHKRCCQEWLRQARTCPVCRMDIPSSLNMSSSSEDAQQPQPPPPTSRLTRPFPGREDFHQDVVGLLQILRRQENRLRQRNASTDAAADAAAEGSSHAGSETETEMVALEEGGRVGATRQHSR